MSTLQPTSVAVAGWYPDPWRTAPLRWWDGTTWTAATAGAPAPPALVAPVAPSPGPSWWRHFLVAAVALALVALSVPVRESCQFSDADRCTPECSADDASEECADFTLYEPFWPSDSAGTVTIHYSVDSRVPAGHQVTGDDLVAAAQRAAETWEAANPRLDFVYDGTTRRRADREDGVSVIGFSGARSEVEDAVAHARLHAVGDGDPEVDVVLASRGTLYVYAPCRQQDGSCVVDDDYAAELDELPTDVEVVELQSVLTHELGHLLGLDHSTAPGDALTMSNEWQNHERFPQTLGRGDVLGVRALYPCECDEPDVLSP